MAWVQQLGKDNKGSRPRCVLLTDGSPDDVAARLTKLINIPDVIVSPSDQWLPGGRGNITEAQFGNPRKPNNLVSCGIHQQLQNWWLVVSATTPNWDIASTATIQGRPGLLLVEAKAHLKELSDSGKSCPTKPNSTDSQRNHQQIGQAIAQANKGLQARTGHPWNLSRDHHYQLSNRFAWAWKLVSLRTPVVLLYLGFLNAQDMAGAELFQSEDDWENALKEHGKNVVDNTCWEQCLDISSTPLFPLIRVYDQPF